MSWRELSYAEVVAQRFACPTQHARVATGDRVPLPELPEWLTALMIVIGYRDVLDCRCLDCGEGLPMLEMHVGDVWDDPHVRQLPDRGTAVRE